MIFLISEIRILHLVAHTDRLYCFAFELVEWLLQKDGVELRVFYKQ